MSANLQLRGQKRKKIKATSEICFVRRQREKGIGFALCTYLQEALGCFPGKAIILWKSYLLPLSILSAGQSIQRSIFFEALLEHLMNCYGRLRTWVIYSQSDSAISKGGFCSRARLKISKGQVVFFEKITQKISTFKPLPIFILSVLSSLPKARLSKNKIFIVFRFSSVTDKTTQNKKDTREVSRIFYSAIAPFNGTKRFEFLL